jgi:hypothetical protein
MSGLQALSTLFFEIRIPISPTSGSYSSIQWSNLLDEASETMPVASKFRGGTGQTG